MVTCNEDVDRDLVGPPGTNGSDEEGLHGEKEERL